MNASFQIKHITRHNHDGNEQVSDHVAVEEPLEIKIAHGHENKTVSSISITMRTPGKDQALAAGFLFTEGIIKNKTDITGFEEGNNVITIFLKEELTIDLPSVSRNFYTTSSCGVCGKASIDAIRVESMVNKNKFTVPSSVINSLAAKIIPAQENFLSTGGLHASAFFDVDGNLLLLQEDVGRHNALDKAIGSVLLSDKFKFDKIILLVSGRASFELVQKAAVAGIPIVAAIGAPSSLAVELADEKGISLIGFLKHDRFNIYSHSSRIKTT
jgi:FdhD protein